ncbi:MAG TPA: hypothetical protein VMH86_05040 [Rhizomicrobium sp.]|nr:hypothetical protein [Rhizomicrobium sp.]
MSDAPAVPHPSLASPPIQFEQRIYARSPFGTLLTTALLFALLFGSFVAVATLEHVRVLDFAGRGFAFSDASWPALVLSLLCCASLGMQRYARLAEQRDAPAYARILAGGMESAQGLTSLAPPDARLTRFTFYGIAIGIAISTFVRLRETAEGHPIPPGATIWFALATTFLAVLFARGVEQTRAGSRGYARMLNAELKIDLLRTDTLTVLGRSAARSALIWLVVSAVACLFFLGNDLTGLTVGLIVACAGMGLGLFVSIMSRIHRQIADAKAAELEHVRGQIDSMRAAMHEDHRAAQRLSGLIAYEKRIADAPEWPFDQSTLMRIAAYILIPTVPWFGQAAAQYFVEHVAQR